MSAAANPIHSISTSITTSTLNPCAVSNSQCCQHNNNVREMNNINATVNVKKRKKMKLTSVNNIEMQILTPAFAANQNYDQLDYVVAHEAGLGQGVSDSSSIRIMETVIAEDTESTTNSPESLPFMPLSASTSFAATTDSMLAIGEYFPFTHAVTGSTSAPERVSMDAAASTASSPKAIASNKFTRKRVRVCNNNSSNIISRMPYFKAFSK